MTPLPDIQFLMSKIQHTSFRTVGEFLDVIPEEERKIVTALQYIIFECIPECEEKLSYNVPFYYRYSRICYIWPASVPWGGVKSGVSIGFCRGYLLSDEIGYLDKGNRNHVCTKTFHSAEEIEPELLKSYLFEATEIDEMAQNE